MDTSCSQCNILGVHAYEYVCVVCIHHGAKALPTVARPVKSRAWCAARLVRGCKWAKVFSLPNAVKLASNCLPFGTVPSHDVYTKPGD